MGNSDCIHFSGSGSAANPFVAAPVIDPDPNNLLSCGPDGLNAQVPDQVRCPQAWKAARLSNQTIADTFETTLTFEECFEFGSSALWDVSDPTKIHVQESGLYQLGLQVAFDIDATGFRTIFVKENGAAVVAGQQVGASPAGVTTLYAGTMTELDAGDFLTCTVIQTSGGPLDVLFDASLTPYFWGYRVRMDDCP